MKHSPKKYDTAVRVIYSSLLIISVFCVTINFSGIFKTIASATGLLLMALAIYFFIKYDATSYEYILMERNETLDFYVNKIVGKRGTYMVYYPLTDCVGYGEYKKDTKENLLKKSSACRFLRYVQNFISARELYFAVFKNNGYYDVIIFEASAEMMRYFKEYAGKAPSSSLHYDDDDDFAQDDMLDNEN